MASGKTPYMLTQRLGDLSPAAKLALAVIQQAIQDANRPEPEPYDKSQYHPKDGAFDPKKLKQTEVVTEDNHFTLRIMRKDAREWLQSGEWQRTTDAVGIGRQTIVEYLLKHCDWYRL